MANEGRIDRDVDPGIGRFSLIEDAVAGPHDQATPARRHPRKPHTRSEICKLVLDQSAREVELFMLLSRHEPRRRDGEIDRRNGVIGGDGPDEIFPAQTQVQREVLADAPVILNPGVQGPAPEVRRKDVNAVLTGTGQA